ncbi:hypothetical protein ACFV10_23960 [Streptomyces cyaneofuscatus]|uniref:ARPP-2 domain-containing protein n=1 Tax=Streptomyces cyaneofuscatus TaxID=66883 RepID=UPI0036A9B108
MRDAEDPPAPWRPPGSWGPNRAGGAACLSGPAGGAVPAKSALATTTSRTSPHGLVADWSGGGEGPEAPGGGGQSAAYGTQLGGGRGGAPYPPAAPATPLHRMAKRRPGDRLRFLPLHLALEGSLALHFGGPTNLLHVLAGADWELSRAAATLGSSREELVRRIRAAGFAQLLKGNV